MRSRNIWENKGKSPKCYNMPNQMKSRTSTSQTFWTGKSSTKNSSKFRPKPSQSNNSENKCNLLENRSLPLPLNTKLPMHKEPLMNIQTHQIGRLNTLNLLSNMFWTLTQSPKRLKRYKTALWFPIPQKIWNKDKIHPSYRNPQNLSILLIPCKFLLI